MVKMKEWRKELGVTQKELAEASDLDLRWIQKIESGEINIENVTVKKFALLLKGFSELSGDEALIEDFMIVRSAYVTMNELLKSEGR